MLEIIMLGILAILIIIAHNIKVIGEKLDRNLDQNSHSNEKDEVNSRTF